MDKHQSRIVKLLKSDANRRLYMKEYMAQYRTTNKQKDYNKPEIKRMHAKDQYYRKTVLNDIKFLFIE